MTLLTPTTTHRGEGGIGGRQSACVCMVKIQTLNNCPYHQELGSFEALLSCTVIFFFLYILDTIFQSSAFYL